MLNTTCTSSKTIEILRYHHQGTHASHGMVTYMMSSSQKMSHGHIIDAKFTKDGTEQVHTLQVPYKRLHISESQA